jgi:ABC-type Fe3+/spermidine/putrescine transport system ATPase subunit
MIWVDVRNIRKKFGKNYVLKDVSLKVERGKIIGVFGHSGCGKTTLLKIIAGFEVPENGEIYLRGEKVFGKKVFIPPEKRNIAFIFQELALWPHLTVKQHLDFVLSEHIKDKNERERKILEILRDVKLEEKVNYKPSDLSGGEKQRLAIARALAKNSDILLCDEPFSSLDIKLKEETIELLKRIWRDKKLTIICVSHDIFEVGILAEKIILMNEGKFLETLDKKTFIKRYISYLQSFHESQLL